MAVEDWIESSIAAFFCFTGIIGNFWLGLRSLPKSRSQLRTSDILFINLAVSNLIRNCMVDLPEFLSLFEKSWLAGTVFCGLTQFCHEIAETSSIYSTMFISIYWYQKLVGSIRRGGAPVRMDNLRLVAALLGLNWTVSVIFSTPHIFIAEHNSNESIEICEELFPTPAEKQIFDALYLTLANVVPIIGINYASIQIAMTLLRNHKRINDQSKGDRTNVNPPLASVEQRAEGTSQRSLKNSGDEGASSKTVNTVSNPPHAVQKTQVRSNPSSNNQVRAAKSVLAVATIFLICWTTHLILRIYSSFYTKSVLALKLINFIGASYLCFVPYVYLYGVRKLNCSCL